LNENQFTGTIRDGFTQFESLDFADFSKNKFTGSLPASIFNIPTIRILYFNMNMLDGTIPLNFGSAPLLKDLYLRENALTGSVPEIEPGQLVSLTEFLVDGNLLTGTMPPSVCQLRVAGVGSLEDLWSDCGMTANPRIECSLPECCTLCYPREESMTRSSSNTITIEDAGSV